MIWYGDDKALLEQMEEGMTLEDTFMKLMSE
ncbi:hypothetical protein BRLA_c026180 [Brevibacillus laterosporus LMG 15441]|uniref:Uncharacterized protein n=1 Tax=Brevibacillus laterosporus LMG 15441 TaxID=1042163 RepID=A0A075R320_BRELA|nr:hypothetical protein BRLA_c026180 [Brevibacillus laterosporus LMG 15441]ERM16035.1 hypothetical protein P615_07010 [Brevibacillus laterosporus PE36]